MPIGTSNYCGRNMRMSGMDHLVRANWNCQQLEGSKVGEVSLLCSLQELVSVPSQSKGVTD